MDFVAIDFETANEKRDSACAIGLVVVEQDSVARRFYSTVRPHAMRFCPWNVRIHGITEEDVKDSPTLNELWPLIWEIVEGRLVVAHNASFDVSVLRHSLRANQVDIPDIQYLCTWKLSSAAWPTLSSHSLGFLAAHFGIELDHHQAESDAGAAATILLKIGNELSVNSAIRLAERLGVSVGELFCDGTWTPSSAPNLGFQDGVPEITLPEGYDITKHPFYGKVVVFTGALEHLTRSQATAVVNLFGGEQKDGVTKKTDFLVAGVQDLQKLATGEVESSKLKKAKELRADGHRIRIITDSEFEHLIFDVSATEEFAMNAVEKVNR